MADILRVGISALHAYQSALNVASQNIANSDTPYYSRRVADFAESQFYTGVNIADVRRLFSDSANQYMQSANSKLAQSNVFLQQCQNFEPLFDDQQTNVGKFILDSLGTLKQVENNGSSSNRALYMGKLTELVNQVQAADVEITRQLNGVNLALETEVNQVNNILSNLANINSEISVDEGQDKLTLFDQRDALIQDLATHLNFKTIAGSDNQVNISLSNGLQLVTGNRYATCATVTDPANPANRVLAIEENSTNIPIDGLIEDGNIGGWINYRAAILEPAQRALNRLALVFSDALNTQNKLGIDANGNLGGNIFTDINNVGVQGDRIIPNTDNASSGNITVSVTDVTQLTASNYQFTVGASNAYALVRVSDNSVVSSGSIGSLPQTINVDGFMMSLDSGTFTANDRYTISPTKNAAVNFNLALADPSELALGWPVTVNTGTQQPGSNGMIKVVEITDTTNSAFSVANQLNPPIEVRFTVVNGVTTYSLYNADTSALIEDDIAYDPATGTDIFPTPDNYDPGYRINILGSHIQDGDTFNIQYNSNGTNDNRNTQAMAALYEAGKVLGNAGQLLTFNQGYNLLCSDISITTNTAQSTYDTSKKIHEQAQNTLSSISGVSLEEETLDLSRFQLAYQASAQVLQSARAIFETIITLARG